MNNTIQNTCEVCMNYHFASGSSKYAGESAQVVYRTQAKPYRTLINWTCHGQGYVSKPCHNTGNGRNT